jgi:hypothetical protein
MRYSMYKAMLFAAALLVPATGRAAAGDLALYDGRHLARIVHEDGGAPQLAKAAELLGRDLTALSGVPAQISTDAAHGAGPGIIIGLAKNPAIAALLKTHHIDTAPLEGKWETYGRAVVAAPWDPKQKALVIFGSDVRGTIWGVMDLTREMGVSPWEWWADVKIVRKARLAVGDALNYSRQPSVKYRAIFLNDEEFGLYPWAATTYDPETHDIGPKTYARIFELMWRLKANTIWPAMRGIEHSFNQVPGNAEMADAYAIIRASSHAEMLGRTNLREWDAAKRGPYNYQNNKQALLDYWDEAVKQYGKYENIYTVGLRGLEDRPMQGTAGPADTARVLEQVVADQRALLARDLGRPADTIPQVFTPYKEVLPAYDAGLTLPDDVTLNWPDDNYGYIRRLSNARERARSGGAGVYYHISYWGYPMSYLWLASTHPALMWEEMNKAYHFNARRIWVLNVGDIKPGEYLSQLFLDMAFDNTAYPDIASVKAHLRRWAAESFGENHADTVAAILWRYYDLAFERNPEAMGWTHTLPATAPHQTEFNMLNFGDENARRQAAYRALVAEAEALEKNIPADRKDAFYELVRYPVIAAADINLRQLNLDKTIAYAYQQRASANDYAKAAEAAQAGIDASTSYYNNVMAGGKWKNMMGQAPHGLPVYHRPQIPAWKSTGDTGCAVQVEGGGYYDAGGSTPGQPPFAGPFQRYLVSYYASGLMPFQPDLKRSSYVDLFLKSPAKAHWTASASAPWIRVSKTQGEFAPGASEARIAVAIDWDKAPADGKGEVTFHCSTSDVPLPVAVTIAPANTVKNVSFIEAQGIVSMYATHADVHGKGWQLLDGLGHTGASLRSDLDMASLATDPASLAKAPAATWRFATTNTANRAALKLTALPFLPLTTDNKMRAAVSIDGAPPQVLDFGAAEFSKRWESHVLTNAATETLPDLVLHPGAHSVTVYALDPGFTLDRLELHFDGAPVAYGPVPETRIRSTP